MIHALPAAANIKNKRPDTKLIWIAQPPQLELLHNNPVIDEVIELPKSAWLSGLMQADKFVETKNEINQFFHQLRNLNIDVAVDLQGLLKSALIGYTSGAPVRIGYKGAREFSDLLYTHRVGVGDYYSFDKHVVEHHIQLSEQVLRILDQTDVESSAHPQFSFPPPSENSKRKIDELLGITEAASPTVEPDSEDRLVANSKSLGAFDYSEDFVFIPCTTWQSKTWPKENWVELAHLVFEKYHSRILLVGGPDDQNVNQEIKNLIVEKSPEATVIDISGRTSISDLLELFGRRSTRSVIGLDTGPLHLAAAVGVPSVLAIHGSTPWLRNGPYGSKCMTVQLELECQPCFKRICPLNTLECLTELTARHVFAKLEKLLASKGEAND